jgi:hypothetical protein
MLTLDSDSDIVTLTTTQGVQAMSNYPDDFKGTPYDNEIEPSKVEIAYDETQIAINKAVDNLSWIHGCSLDMTSEAVCDRWNYLKTLFASIRRYGDKYSPEMMEEIEALLTDEVKWASKQNVTFDRIDENTTECFADTIRGYGDIILTRLKKDM